MGKWLVGKYLLVPKQAKQGCSCRGVQEGASLPPPPPQVFGRSDNSIQTKKPAAGADGQIMPNTLLLPAPQPPDSKSYLHLS